MVKAFDSKSNDVSLVGSNPARVVYLFFCSFVCWLLVDCSGVFFFVVPGRGWFG